MFDFFIDTYKEYVQGIDVETEKQIKKEEAKASKIIYPKDVKIVTYVLASIYLISAILSSVITVRLQGIGFSVIASGFLSIIAILVMYFLSRKTKKGEITAIVLSVLFAVGLYGTMMLSPLFI